MPTARLRSCPARWPHSRYPRQSRCPACIAQSRALRIAWGLVVGAKKAGLKLFLGSYPITPASALLHTLANLKPYGVTTFQAEDEISAVCSAIGASYAGQLGITSSSGPGVALKTEALGLAFATELP